MMNRNSRHRLSKIEKAVSIAQKESKERKRQLIKAWRYHARYHAIAVAAIVLSGQPKIDEPLNKAWTRALRHYGIEVGEWGGIDDQVRAAQQLLRMIIGEEEILARLAEIFRTAPVWLLQFTGIARDASLLNFHLSEISGSRFIWGSVGFEDARRWPLLPFGTMMAGDPIPIDWQRLWLAYFILVGPILDDDNPSQEKEEDLSRNVKDIRDDFHFALDLDRKPEEEWSPYEKRRMRKIFQANFSCEIAH